MVVYNGNVALNYTLPNNNANMLVYCIDNDIDGEAFLELAKDDLEKMNLKVGAVVKLLKIQKVLYFNLATCVL